MFAVYF